MNIFKELLLLCFTLCALCISEIMMDHQFRALLPQKFRKYRRFNSADFDENNCFCFKNNPGLKTKQASLNTDKHISSIVQNHQSATTLKIPSGDGGNVQHNGARSISAMGTNSPNLHINGIQPSGEHDFTEKVVKKPSISFSVPTKVINENPISLNTPNTAPIRKSADFSVQNSGKLGKKDFAFTDSRLNFNQWFQDQMHLVQMASPMESNEIDVVMLKKLIENTLRNHGMVMSNEGVLEDSFGNILNMANLQLRLILIGDSVGYDHILKESDKFSLPSDFLYLKSILVSLLHPPKILGIIPLGQVHLLNSKEVVNTFTTSLGSTARENYLKHLKDFLENLESKENKNIDNISTSRTSFSDASNNLTDNKTQIINTKNEETLPNAKLSNDKELEQNTTRRRVTLVGEKFVEESSESDESRRGIPEKESEDELAYRILGGRTDKSSVRSFINPSKVGTSPNPTRPSKLNDIAIEQSKKVLASMYGEDSLEEPAESEEGSSEDQVLSVEEPGFRIIGGQAATSSGTPINVRGRSGWHGLGWN